MNLTSLLAEIIKLLNELYLTIEKNKAKGHQKEIESAIRNISALRGEIGILSAEASRGMPAKKQKEQVIKIVATLNLFADQDTENNALTNLELPEKVIKTLIVQQAELKRVLDILLQRFGN